MSADIYKAAAESLRKQADKRSPENIVVADKQTQPRLYMQQYLEKQKQEFAKYFEQLSPEEKLQKISKFFRVVITYFNKNPKLFECTEASISGCLHASLELGLEIGVLGQADMIPYWNRKKKPSVLEAQFIPGYQGLIHLAQNTGQMREINSSIVYEGDIFDYEYGTNSFLKHKPQMDADNNRKRLCAYAYAKTIEGGFYFTVMSIRDLERIRQKYSGSPDSPAWVNETDWMYRKTALRQLQKMLPKSTTKDYIKFARAVQLDDINAHGLSQELDPNNVDAYGIIDVDEKKIYEDAEILDTEDPKYPDPPEPSIIKEEDPRLSDPTYFLQIFESSVDPAELTDLFAKNESHILNLTPSQQKLINTVYKTRMNKLIIEGK